MLPLRGNATTGEDYQLSQRETGGLLYVQTVQRKFLPGKGSQGSYHSLQDPHYVSTQ